MVNKMNEITKLINAKRALRLVDVQGAAQVLTNLAEALQVEIENTLSLRGFTYESPDGHRMTLHRTVSGYQFLSYDLDSPLFPDREDALAYILRFMGEAD